jgi:hypothetical protein
MRVTCGGTLVEDIDNYNRTHQMFDQLTARDSRKNKMVEGFGNELDIYDAGLMINTTGGTAPRVYPGIKGLQSQTVLFKPLFGLFTQNKYIPLKYAGPIIIELEVADNNDPIELPISGQTLATQYFIDDNTSTTWEIGQVQIKCDVCTLDNHVENIFTKHMLEGGSFPIRYNNYISQLQPILATQPSVMVNITRSTSKLKSCFVTLNKNSGPDETKAANRNWNEFGSPMSFKQLGNGNNCAYDSDYELDSCYVQIGSKRFPEFPITSHAEAFYQLTKCLGVQASDIHNLDINPFQYHAHKFNIGIDLEKVLEAKGTGFNTKACDLLTVSFKQKKMATWQMKLAQS